MVRPPFWLLTSGFWLLASALRRAILSFVGNRSSITSRSGACPITLGQRFVDCEDSPAHPLAVEGRDRFLELPFFIQNNEAEAPRLTR